MSRRENTKEGIILPLGRIRLGVGRQPVVEVGPPQHHPRPRDVVRFRGTILRQPQGTWIFLAAGFVVGNTRPKVEPIPSGGEVEKEEKTSKPVSRLFCLEAVRPGREKATGGTIAINRLGRRPGDGVLPQEECRLTRH